MNNTPIFIGVTRSFLLGIVPALLVLLDVIVQLTAPGTLGPISQMISAVTDLAPQQVESVMGAIGTVAALVVAHQRRGAARPYTLKVSSETLR